MKALLVVVAAALAGAPTVGVHTYPHDEKAIVRVECGPLVGTAVKIGTDTYITAAHVVEGGQCQTADGPVTVTSIKPKLDYATFVGASSPSVIRVSCKGFTAGQMYLARGFAGGGFENFALPWWATGSADDSQNTFIGEAIPGMSGGAVLDKQGNVAGIVNRRWPARSLPLTATPLCGA